MLRTHIAGHGGLKVAAHGIYSKVALIRKMLKVRVLSWIYAPWFIACEGVAKVLTWGLRPGVHGYCQADEETDKGCLPPPPLTRP